MFHVFSLEPISPYLTIYLSKKTDLYEYMLGHHRPRAELHVRVVGPRPPQNF